MRALWMVVGMGLLSLAAVGCQSNLAKERDMLLAQNRDLQAQNNEMQQRLGMAVDPSQVKALQDEIARRDAEIAELKKNLRTPDAGQSPAGLEGIDVKYDPKAGTVTANLPGDVLFDSGQATLKSSAKGTLNKIVAALKKQYAGKPVRVEGNTDSDPVVRTRQQWTDNWGLAAARALAVTRYLHSQGIDDKRLSVVSYGANKPKGASKAANRRVEIVVVVR